MSILLKQVYRILFFIILASSFWLISCTKADKKAQDNHLSLVYSSNVLGEVEPCG